MIWFPHLATPFHTLTTQVWSRSTTTPTPPSIGVWGCGVERMAWLWRR